MPTYKYQEPNFTKYLKDQKFQLAEEVGFSEVMSTDTKMCGLSEDGQTTIIVTTTVRSYVTAYVNYKKKTLAFQITHEYEAPDELPEALLIHLDKEARDHVEESGKSSLQGCDFRKLQVKGNKVRVVKK